MFEFLWNFVCCPGTAFEGIPASKEWYPVVGIDSNSPIAFNFGSRPFQFDIKAHANQVWQAVAASRGWPRDSLEIAKLALQHPVVQKVRVLSELCWH